MPIYAYACSACGFRQDILQKLSDPALTECPSCHQAHFSKQLTAPGFVLKGSGWYVTDFRDNGTKKSGDSAAKTAEPAAKTAEPNGAGDSAANNNSNPNGASGVASAGNNPASGSTSSATPSTAAGASTSSSPVAAGS
jgi:putative FmdB family regulatory protein